ncbi:MAG: KdsC family phosphatase [Thermodesulfobacteriota bacterium]
MEVALNGEVAGKARAVRLLVLDVDGVLTDGRLIYTDDGAEAKAFDVKDGHGIKLLQRSGVDVAIVTGRTSGVVEHRARNLGIELVYQGMLDKTRALDDIIERTGLDAGELAYVADDVVDLPFLSRVGFSVAVADASGEVRARADYVTTRPGGRGAVREVCELILKAQGSWDRVMARYRD